MDLFVIVNYLFIFMLTNFYLLFIYMEVFYKNKYLKYKQKYLLSGGECANCAKIGFQQHHGECWHDSFSTIMLFSDDFSEGIQKIFTSEFDANMRIRRVISKPESYYKYFLPPNIPDSGPDFDKFCSFASTYLSNLNKLFQNELKPLDKRVDAVKISLSCVAQAFNVNNINRIEEKKYDRFDHGGMFTDNVIISTVYNYFLRESTTKYLILKKFELKDITKEKITEFLDLLPRCFGIYIGLIAVDNDFGSGHATGFFQCKSKKYFFDDNGISSDPKDKKTFIEFDWKTYLTNKMNILSTSDKDTYTIISDFLNGHGKAESKIGQKYLEDFMINQLVLFISHEPTTEEEYHKNNYHNYKKLICFSTDKIRNLITKHITPVEINDVLFNCVEYNNLHLLKELTTKFKLKLIDYKIKYGVSSISLFAKAALVSKTMNDTIKFLLEQKFDINEVLVDDLENFNIFLSAVINNNIEFVKYLLSQNKDLINSQSLDGKSGLYIAAIQNNYEMVKLLINNNIDISIKFNDKSPLCIALEYNVYSNEEDYYRDYLEHTDPSKILKKIEIDEIKYFDSNRKIIKELLDKNAFKYEKDIFDSVAYAFEYNNLEAVQLIFDKRYNIKINFNGLINRKTLLDYSIIYKNSFITKYSGQYLAPVLRDFIKNRDMERNIAIVEMLLKQRLNKKTIETAIKLVQKEKKPTISRKLLEIKV